MQRLLIATVFGLAAFFLLACTDQSGSGTTGSATSVPSTQSMRPVEPATGTVVSRAPWLRTVLPKNAFAYVRIPNLWGLLGVPTGTVFDRAVGSQVYVDAMKSIRSGVLETILPEMGDDITSLWQLLLAHARSPVEIAALIPGDKNAPLPEVLLSVELDFDSVDKLNLFLNQAASANPALAVSTPLGTDGRGILSLAGMPAFLKFNPDNGRLVMLAGSGNSSAVLDKQISSLNTVADHRMYKLESELDSGGQGLFAWIDPGSLATMTHTPAGAALGAMALIGAQDMKAVAFGMGSAGGKQRISMVVEMPATGMRNFIPLVNTDASVKSAGELSSVIMLGMPQVDDIKRIETQLSMMLPPESMQQYFGAMEAMKQKLGFDVKDILNALGPEMIVLFDDAGSYMAVRVKDATAFDEMIAQLQKRPGITLEQRIVGDRTYQHIKLPSFPDSSSVEEADQSLLLKRILALPSHLYWTKEDGYLLISATPQPLIDRYYLKPGMSVSVWLKEQQKLESKNSLLLASGRNQGLPAFMYDLNLQVLLALGDLVERPIDLFAFPTPREAGLPEYGGISFKIDSSETRLAMEFSYDNNLGELLFAGGGMAAIATTGILAAIAIPAYQDYTIRARVVEGFSASAQHRFALEEFIIANKRLPDTTESKSLPGISESELVTDWVYDEDSGTISIQLAIKALGEDNIIHITPQVKDNIISWVCSGEMKDKYLPKSCRE